MPTHPKDKPPEFATDATWTAGPDTGQPVRVSASLAEQKQGMVGGNEYPASKFNDQLGRMGDHVRNLSELALRTWDRVDTWKDPTLTPAIDFDFADVHRGIFAYKRGVEGAGRLQIYGNNSAGTGPRSRWTHVCNVWRNHSYGAGTGAIRDMAANANGSTLIAVGTGTSNNAYYTTDAQTFTDTPTHTGTSHYVSCCFADGLFWGITDDASPKIGKSSDGVTWTAAAVQPFGAASGGKVRAGKVGGADAVLAVASTTTYVSTDGGASWSAAGTLAHGARDIRYSEALGVWVAVSSGLAVSTSSDGVTWVNIRAASISGIVTSLDGVQALANDGGAAWVVAGSIPSGTAPGPFLAYSTDLGLTWTFVLLDEGPAEAGVCWHPAEQRFYAFCHPVATLNSPDRGHLLYRTPSYGTGGGIIPV